MTKHNSAERWVGFLLPWFVYNQNSKWPPIYALLSPPCTCINGKNISVSHINGNVISVKEGQFSFREIYNPSCHIILKGIMNQLILPFAVTKNTLITNKLRVPFILTLYLNTQTRKFMHKLIFYACIFIIPVKQV